MSAPLLRVEGLTAGYGRGEVLRDLSIEVAERTTVSIIGPNGAGKTTLIRCVSGALRPSGGRVVFDGEEVTGLRPVELVRRGIMQVPQGRHLFGELTVEENLRLGGHSVRRRIDVERRIEELVEIFPIVRERRGQLAHTLSGGQQQMVAIARGLVCEPRLLLLDEPSVGLAPAIIDDVGALVAQIKAAGCTVLLAEQNVPLALSLADHVHVIANGAVAAHGTPAEIEARDDARRAYLGLPDPAGAAA
ncbi:MAG TPA: ABC transporter ATP-binding protein [Conexibacter sp.]|jgi:ABC-type branched-subunit amino acid transport system ATPase component